MDEFESLSPNSKRFFGLILGLRPTIHGKKCQTVRGSNPAEKQSLTGLKRKRLVKVEGPSCETKGSNYHDTPYWLGSGTQ